MYVMMNKRADILFMKEMDYFKICKSNYRAGCANLIANAFGKLGQYLQSTWAAFNKHH